MKTKDPTPLMAITQALNSVATRTAFAQVQHEQSMYGVIGILLSKQGTQYVLTEAELEEEIHRYQLDLEKMPSGALVIRKVMRKDDDYCPTCDRILDCLDPRAVSYLTNDHWKDHRKTNPHLKDWDEETHTRKRRK